MELVLDYSLYPSLEEKCCEANPPPQILGVSLGVCQGCYSLACRPAQSPLL